MSPERFVKGESERTHVSGRSDGTLGQLARPVNTSEFRGSDLHSRAEFVGCQPGARLRTVAEAALAL
jgi:hypothetical protein